MGRAHVHPTLIIATARLAGIGFVEHRPAHSATGCLRVGAKPRAGVAGAGFSQSRKRPRRRGFDRATAQGPHESGPCAESPTLR